MVLRRMRAEGIERTLLRLQNMLPLDAQLADHLDVDTTFRLAARLDGVPEDVLRAEHRVKRMRREREEQATAAAALAAGEPPAERERAGDAGPPPAELLPGAEPAPAPRAPRRPKRPKYEQADLPLV